VTAKTVLILGGGTGGLVAASRLRRALDKENRIVLVDRSPYYTFQPSLSWVMLGQRSLPRITRDLRDLRKKRIEVKTAEIVSLDLANKKVQFAKEEMAYDYLIIALGAAYSDAEVPGLNRAWTYYHPDGADGIHEELPLFSSGRIVLAAAALPYKCPPSLYEGAFLLDDYFRKRRLRPNIDIHIYTPEPTPLTQYGAETCERVTHLLRSREIGFSGGLQMKSVDHDKRLIEFQAGELAPFDMLIAAPVHVLPPVLSEAGLAGADGWLAADRETLLTAAADVYAIGDCNSVPIADGQTLPKSGVFAHGEAEVVARNLAAQIVGRDSIWAFGGQGACFMETGGGHGAYLSGNFYTDPPQVAMGGPSRLMHWAKVGSERVWLWRWF
jgi:sulfide:quinone oxidoreductase